MKLLLFLVLAAVAVAFAVWNYRRRELPVAGRWVPTVLRAAALVIALVLVFDPRLPALGRAPETWVLVDGSVSMGVAAAGQPTAWERALPEAERLRAAGARVLRFGGEPAAPPADSALGAPPGEARTRLVPALERAAESGAREVVVISDFRLEDPVAARAAFDRLGLAARFVPVGEEVRNAGIAELTLPDDLDREQPVEGELAVFGSGAGEGDTLTVEVREEGRLIWSGRVGVPASGRLTRVPLLLPPPSADAGGGGEIRYEATVALADDRFADDDRRVAYAVVDPREGALVAVSLTPDWELRTLVPVLERVTGLPTRGYLRSGDRFLAMGGEDGPPLGADELADRIRDARLVVLHGVGEGDPAWARDAAGSAARVLLFPRDLEGAAAGGIATGSVRGGEWYLDPEPPTSPLTGELVGLPYPALPPLGDLLPLSGGSDAAAPLQLRLRGTGPASPALVLRERDGGRIAVALATGWWRWALRPGADEEAYGRVWSAVAGWLLGGEAAPSGRVRPLARLVDAGATVEWTGSTVAPVRVTVYDGDRVVTDTTLSEPARTLRTPTLPPGSYRYVTRAGADSVSGRFDVQGSSAELRHARMQLPDSIAAPPGARADQAGRPLRANPVPWLLLIGLLCGEWVTRRRKGLR